MKIKTPSHIKTHARQVMGWKQHWQQVARNGDKHYTAGWYKNQPEEGTPEAAAHARRMTPGQGVKEGASNCNGTGSTNADTQRIKHQYTTQKPKKKSNSWNVAKSAQIKRDKEEQNEEFANSIGAGTIPNSTENPEGSRKKKWQVLTRHYIEIGGKRRKQTK